RPAPRGQLPPLGHLRRQDPQGCQTGRAADRAIHEARNGHQSQECEGPRLHGAAGVAGHRRRGDRVSATMNRRTLISLSAGAAPSALCWPLEPRAQQARKLPIIGVLGPTNAAVASKWTAALVQRLRELGWVEGRTVSIEYRWAQGHADRASEIASEFARVNV